MVGRAASVIVSPDLHIGDYLERRRHEANFTDPPTSNRRPSRFIHTQRFHLVIAFRVEETNLHTRSN